MSERLGQLSHDARGHVTQVATPGHTLLLLANCQQAWIQDKVGEAVVHRALELTGLDTAALKLKSSNERVKTSARGDSEAAIQERMEEVAGNVAAGKSPALVCVQTL